MNRDAIPQSGLHGPHYLMWRRLSVRSIFVRYGLAFIVIVLITATMLLTGQSLDPSNISLIYLLAVLFTATYTGTGPGITASIMSFLAYNFFFVQPLYILTVNRPEDVTRLISYLIAAVLASSLAGRVRRQTEQLGERAAALQSLYTLSQTTSAAVDLDQILPTFADTTVELLHVTACALTVALDGHERVFTAPKAISLPLMQADSVTMPLQIEGRVVGTITVVPQIHHTLSSTEQRSLQTLAGQVALAVERARLVDQVTATHILAESERLKSALLSSVSHDLRTPLATIKGAATALYQEDMPWNTPAGKQLVATLIDEADRLNRLVGNLLDMSRIEGGALNPARAWEDLGEIVGVVLAHMRPILSTHPLYISVPSDLPLIWVNAILIDQVLTNVLENAVTYTPAETLLRLAAHIQGEELWIEVADEGPGIPPDALPHIFDKFFRVIGPERHADGTGLGLAISAGILAVHGGRMWAENRPTGGAVFTIALPLHPPDASPPPTFEEGDARDVSTNATVY